MQTRSSPNQNARPEGVTPRLIVIHGTAGTDEGDRSWIANPASNVSYHHHVGRDGSVVQFVPDQKRAWHAGVSEWRGVRDCNDYSLGIGFGAYEDEGYTAEAYQAGSMVVAKWMHQHKIPLAGVVGHYHVSPGRKTDPWYSFEWGRFLGLVLAYYSVFSVRKEGS